MLFSLFQYEIRGQFSALPPLFCHIVAALFPFDRGEQETRHRGLNSGN